MKTPKSTKGFTLIELLIVIAIIGILAVAFLPSILGAPAKGRDAARIADLQKIQKVLLNANLDGKAWPSGTGPIDGTSLTTGYTAPADKWGGAFGPDFGGIIPTDPLTTQILPAIGSIVSPAAGKYYYKRSPSASYSFALYALVEDWNNANSLCSTAANATPTISAPTASTAATDLCYVILSQ